MSGNVYNVRSYGAVGDGKTKDTRALQQAIDACAEQGGGTVVVPAGTYVTGTLWLRSHTELKLDPGSQLLASLDREDYNADDAFEENIVFQQENVSGAHLIIAYRAHNVSLTGSGTINGNGARFFDPIPEGKTASYWFKTASYQVRSWRPGQMVFFCRCTDVIVRDVSLVHSTYWNLFVLGCSNVHIRGLTIDNPAETPNGDGIDIDCSRHVTISDCTIRGGDDCITFRANTRALGQTPQPCEHISVTNCVLYSPTCAFRVGVGDGLIRNCSVSNIVIGEARTAVNMVMRYSESSRAGSRIEQVHFSDVVADVCMPFVVGTGTGAIPPAYIRDISFHRFRVTARAGSQLAGTEEVALERIRISELALTIHGGSDNRALAEQLPRELSKFGYHGQAGLPALPCAIYGTYLREASFDRVRVRWEELGAVWSDGLWLRDSDDIELAGIRLRQPQQDSGAAIRLEGCKRATVSASRADAGTTTFIRVERPADGAEITLLGNDCRDAALAVEADAALSIQESGSLLPG